MLEKVPCIKSGTFWFPWMNHHSVALVLLYNMRLERSFSIKRIYQDLKKIAVLAHHSIAHVQVSLLGELHLDLKTRGERWRSLPSSCRHILKYSTAMEQPGCF